MKRIEYRTVDKSGWGDGPWQTEPDKIQWQDAETGYPCLIVRNGVGALCGYVGVPEGHPVYKKDYDDVSVSAHGGLTFADACHEPTEQRWHEAQERFIRSVKEAKKYSHGDAAEFVREWGPSLQTYERYVAKKQETSVCHLPTLHEPDDVWWLGFDCSHWGDLSPKMGKYGFRERPTEDTYKDVAYVTHECEALAAQLKALET